MRFQWATQAAKLLKGVFCVYKPEGISDKALLKTIKENLARGKKRYVSCFLMISINLHA